jgi:hypothetical protein
LPTAENASPGRKTIVGMRYEWDHFPNREGSTRQLLQWEATEAVIDTTTSLKPAVKRNAAHERGASVHPATRRNADQFPRRLLPLADSMAIPLLLRQPDMSSGHVPQLIFISGVGIG